MHLVLIPGFWLDASSWDGVAGALRDAGHSDHALTLPGLESRGADRSGIGLCGHVDALRQAEPLLDEYERLWRDRFDRIGDLLAESDQGDQG